MRQVNQKYSEQTQAAISRPLLQGNTDPSAHVKGAGANTELIKYVEEQTRERERKQEKNSTLIVGLMAEASFTRR